MRSYRLVVEGDGDRVAAQTFLKKVASYVELPIYPVRESIKAGGIDKLQNPVAFERVVRRVELDQAAHGTIVLVDCDDGCPVEHYEHFRDMANEFGFSKPIGVILLKKEFESLFLHCLDQIRESHPDFGWDEDGIAQIGDPEEIRGAKELLNKLMKSRYYKENRDQQEFARSLDVAHLFGVSRATRRAAGVLRKMYASSGAVFV